MSLESIVILFVETGTSKLLEKSVNVEEYDNDDCCMTVVNR